MPQSTPLNAIKHEHAETQARPKREADSDGQLHVNKTKKQKTTGFAPPQGWTRAEEKLL